MSEKVILTGHSGALPKNYKKNPTQGSTTDTPGMTRYEPILSKISNLSSSGGQGEEFLLPKRNNRDERMSFSEVSQQQSDSDS